MTVRIFLLGSLASIVLSWGVWALIIMWLDPVEAGWIGFLLFFLALFLAVASTAALLGYGVRRLLQPGQLPAYRVRTAMRQGIWLGVFLDILLLLQLQRLLQWWITVIAIVLFLSLELLFLSYERSGNNHSGHSARRRS